MSAYLAAALGMVLAMIPLGAVIWRGTLMAAVVAYEAMTSVVVLVLVLVPAGFGRASEFELPVLLAVLLLGSGLVFLRALESWL